MALAKVKVVSVPVVRTNGVGWLDLASTSQFNLRLLWTLQAVDVDVLWLLLRIGCLGERSRSASRLCQRVSFAVSARVSRAPAGGLGPLSRGSGVVGEVCGGKPGKMGTGAGALGAETDPEPADAAGAGTGVGATDKSKKPRK